MTNSEKLWIDVALKLANHLIKIINEDKELTRETINYIYGLQNEINRPTILQALHAISHIKNEKLLDDIKFKKLLEWGDKLPFAICDLCDYLENKTTVTYLIKENDNEYSN